MLSYLPYPLPDYLPYTAAGSPPEPVEALLHIARAMTRASHGPAGPRVKSSPRSPQAAYPAPTLRLPTDLPYTSRPAYPTPPSQVPALHQPYTSRAAYPAPPSQVARPAPPERPTLHLPTSPPCTSRAAYPTPAACQTPDAARSADHAEPSLLSPDRPTLHRVPATREAKSPGLPSDLPYTAPRPRENDRVAIPQQPHPRVLPVRPASCVAGGLSLGNLGEEGLTLSRS